MLIITPLAVQIFVMGGIVLFELQIIAAGFPNSFALFTAVSTVLTLITVAGWWESTKKIHEENETMPLTDIYVSDAMKLIFVLVIAVLCPGFIGHTGFSYLVGSSLGVLIGAFVALVLWVAEFFFEMMRDDEEGERAVKASRKAAQSG